MAASPRVTTRFAPSPTGFLHIGGARTALFNWLYARNQGGRFLLRIEDTDKARSTQDAVDAILDGLNWLELPGDEPAIYQSARAERHAEVAQELIAKGAAYRCYMTEAETDAEREAAKAEGRALRSPWRDQPASSASDGPFVVRLKAPNGSDTIVEDRVQGSVRFANTDLDDLVLLRADGTPTYMLAVVVDDHDMAVSHVIRGDDHLVNAARQSLIFQSMDWPVPVFAHIPLIHGPDGKKLSKRHGALGVEAYREMGYLPEALRNYLLRLGWASGDRELLSTEDAIRLFDLGGVNKSPARLDFDKLNAVNAHYIRGAADDRLAELALAQIAQTGLTLDPVREARARAGVGALKDRAKTIPDLVDQCGFLLAQRPLEMSGKVKKPLTAEALDRLARLAARLETLEPWSAETVQSALDQFAEAEGVGFGKIGPPVRAAVTAGRPAPDLAVTLALLGRQETLGRINDQVATRGDTA